MLYVAGVLAFLGAVLHIKNMYSRVMHEARPSDTWSAMLVSTASLLFGYFFLTLVMHPDAPSFAWMWARIKGGFLLALGVFGWGVLGTKFFMRGLPRW